MKLSFKIGHHYLKIKRRDVGQSVISQLEYDKLWLIELKFGLRTLKLFVLVANFAVQTSKGSTLLFHLRIVCCLCNMHFIFNTIIRFKMINILVFKLQVGLMSVRENTFLKSISIYTRYIFPNLSSNPRVEAWRIKRYIVFRKCIYFWCAFLSPVVTNPECLV